MIAHTRLHKQVFTCAPAHTHAHTCTFTHTHARTHMHVHAHTYSCTHVRSHTRSRTHAHAHTQQPPALQTLCRWPGQKAGAQGTSKAAPPHPHPWRPGVGAKNSSSRAGLGFLGEEHLSDLKRNYILHTGQWKPDGQDKGQKGDKRIPGGKSDRYLPSLRGDALTSKPPPPEAPPSPGAVPGGCGGQGPAPSCPPPCLAALPESTWGPGHQQAFPPARGPRRPPQAPAASPAGCAAIGR